MQNSQADERAVDAEQCARRKEMVKKQLEARGICDARVLMAMAAVPRHVFVPPELLAEAYGDKPLAIGENQTISQPFIVASMTEALQLSGAERVLEVGTGSGYQTAVLSLLADEVHTIERSVTLANAARERLARLGYGNIHFHTGDGTLGLPEAAPFGAILVTAAAPLLPPPLLDQMAESGRLVLPLGSADTQEMARVRRTGGDFATERLYHCRFVPLLGQYGWSATP